MKSSRKDILFQREGKHVDYVNPGFIVFRANSRVADFYTRVLTTILSGDQKNDQFIINPMLRLENELAWDYLPLSFYARTHGWPPGPDIALYHANFTPGPNGVGQKIAQFQELQWVRRHGAPALAWSCLKRVPGKLARSISGRFLKMRR